MPKNSKWKKGILIFLLLVLLVNIAVVIFNKRFIYKAVWYNFVNIDDYKIFYNRDISPSPNPEPWPFARDYNQQKLTDRLLDGLHQLESVAFLVIKDDSLKHEQYWDNYSPESLSNSFSMAKTYVGVLTGIALREGYIRSLDQSVGDYLPEFRGGEMDKIKIRHLLTMSSGLNWDESYASPFSITTEAYYGTDLRSIVGTLELQEEPGVFYNYRSGDTQLLAFVLQKATGRTLSKYLEEKIWHPTGSENLAKWSLDDEGGMEKAYCCISSNARDFARLGKLFLDKGNWNGKQLIDSAYVEESLTPANLQDPLNPGEQINFYGYKWWLIPNYKKLGDIFYARGILGQYIIAVPSENLIIVRLGHKRGAPVGNHIEEVYLMLDEVPKIYSN